MLKAIKGVKTMIWYNLAKRVILAENYASKEDMQSKIDNYFTSGKITQTQKEELERLLNSAN